MNGEVMGTNLSHDVLLVVCLLGFVTEVVDTDLVTLLPQLVQGTVVDLQPLVAVGQFHRVDLDVFGRWFGY